MLETIPWGQVGVAGSGWALATYAMYLVMSGRLIPRTTYDDVVDDRNEWRSAARIKDEQIAEKDRQLGDTAEVGKTMQAVLTAIQSIGGRPGGRDEELTG